MTKADAQGTKTRTGRGLRRGDVVLIALVLAAVAAFAVMQGAPALADADGDAAGWAIVQNAEGFYQELPLSQDARLEVTSAEGSNTVVVSGGAVQVEEADCKNQVCVQAGAVNRAGDVIVCLPHRMVVQVVAHPEDAAPVEGALS